MVGALRSVTSPGLVDRSRFVATPAWKSAWVVSRGQALVGAFASEKSWVVVPPSATPMLVALAGL